jgi:hypothetical protein
MEIRSDFVLLARYSASGCAPKFYGARMHATGLFDSSAYWGTWLGSMEPIGNDMDGEWTMLKWCFKLNQGILERESERGMECP